MDPRSGLDDVEKRKFLTLPGLELVALRYTDCAIPAPYYTGQEPEYLNRCSAEAAGCTTDR
jgi:hypothetical protein